MDTCQKYGKKKKKHIYFFSVIYWSDWGSHPKIEKANYDGSNRQTIVSSGLGFPNALSLDLQG